MPDEVTIGELARRIDRVERQLSDGFRDVNRTIENQQFVHIDRYDADRDALVHRVKALESTNTWLVRTVAAVVISTVVQLVLGLLLIRGGA